VKKLRISVSHDNAVDVIMTLVKQGASFKVDSVDELPEKEPAKLAPAKGLGRGRGYRKRGAGGSGLRAILKAGMGRDSFTSDDVREACVALGVKAVSASPNLTHYRRDGRYIEQLANKSYKLTELGQSEALTAFAEGSLSSAG
jgi:hypothetical protein